MKKRMLSLLFLSGVLMCQPVMAMDKAPMESEKKEAVEADIRASDYIVEYMGELYNTGNTLELTSHLIAMYTDKIEIKAQIQSYSNGTWSNYGSSLKNTSTSSGVSLDREKTVPDGRYRIKYTFNAYVDDAVVETRSETTGSVYVP